MQQIGDKEHEIDKLIKLSAKDLWNKDLDDFIAEWRFQLEDDVKRQKKVANLGRRASNKLKIGAKGPAAKKRKAIGEDPDDSDFAASKPKKAGGVSRVNPKSGLAFFAALKKASGSPPAKSSVDLTSSAVINAIAEKKPVQPINGGIGLDGSSDPINEDIESVLKFTQPSKVSGGKKGSNSVSQGESSSAMVDMAKPAGRGRRLAASKPVKYEENSDSESDNGDGMLGDVSKMVKGVGGGAGSKPLFSGLTSKTTIGAVDAKSKI